MIQENSIEASLARVPCFSCPYCYSCRYWGHPLWRDWVLNNPCCPAQYYTFESIFTAVEIEAKKRKELRDSIKPASKANDLLSQLYPEDNTWKN